MALLAEGNGWATKSEWVLHESKAMAMKKSGSKNSRTGLLPKTFMPECNERAALASRPLRRRTDEGL